MGTDDKLTPGAETPPETPGEQRGGYLGFVAHEVRNPLSTALWTAELLARMSTEERGGARGDKLSAMCLRSLSRVRQLIEDHFMCERLDAAGIPLRIEPIGVREILDAIVQRQPAEAPPVVPEIAPDTACAVDRVLFERGLEALVAVAGREGKPLRLIAAVREETVRIAIEGFAPPPASSLEDPTKGAPSDPKGRALALPLARRVAETLGGSLAVSSDGFVLTLPRAPAYTSRAPAAHP